MKAVGAYLKTLREGRGLSRPWVADRAGTNDTSVYRVETRGQEPGPRILIGFVRAVQGSFEDVDELLKDDDLPVEVGVELAQLRLNQEVDRTINGMEHRDARRLADRMYSDPEFFEVFIREVVERGKRTP